MTTHVTGVNSQLDGKQAAQPATDAVVEALLKEETVKKENVKEEAKIANPKKLEKATMHAGMDIGTMNLIASRQVGKNTEYKRIRDVFLDLTDDQVKMLKLSGDTSYIKKDGICYVLGDSAADVANIFGRKLRAPMNKGVIAAGEIEAMEILKVMVGEVLGNAPSEGGLCFVSSPGDPIDSEFDALYHQAVVKDIVSSYGWTVETTSESTAMAYSECADTNFTGLCLSFGHGMVNVSLVFKTIETLKFSVARSGSWIDEQSAKVTGKTTSQMCALKEKGIDLLKPIGREQQAISVYYKHLIGYVIQNFIKKFREIQGNIELPNEIPCVIAGGSALPKSFIDIVKQEINKNKGFPFAISEVRLAKDPMNSIAKGLLIMAQNK